LENTWGRLPLFIPVIFYSWLVAVGEPKVIDITTMRIWFIATGLNE